MAKKVINIGDAQYVIKFDEFEDDIEIDDLLKIDYSNLIGEIVTFPSIVNKFGLMLADAESQVQEKKLSLEIYEAKCKERLRITLAEANNGKNPTVDQLNSAVLNDKGYQAARRTYINAQKVRDYLNSCLWAAKDKDGLLQKLSLSINVSDVPEGVIEGRVNHTLIRKSKRVIE